MNLGFKEINWEGREWIVLTQSQVQVTACCELFHKMPEISLLAKELSFS